MIKSALTRKIATLAFTTLCTLLPYNNSAHSATFDETEVQQTSFIAVAQPYGDNKYNLIVIEQIPDRNDCWSEFGGNPINVDLLLANFDFSGHCRRSTDANGYSIRYDGQDLGLNFLLSLVEKDGNLVLMGMNRLDPRQPPIILGTAEGISNQPMKIQLYPGWRFTKRTYQGKVLGHVYFSYDSTSSGQNPMPMTDDNVDMMEEGGGMIQDIVAPSANP